MTVLFDTSVLVAAVLRQHPAHPEAAAWLQAVKSEERSGVVAAHSIVELYSVLTRLPLHPRIEPDTARRSFATMSWGLSASWRLPLTTIPR